MSTPRPTDSTEDHPSPSDLMRLRLAKARLQELRDMDLSTTHQATVILTAERLGHSVEDLIEMLLTAWPEESSWSGT